MKTPSIGYVSAAALGLYGCWWIARGARIVGYQKNVRRRRRWTMRARKVPVSRDCLFIGRGFRWGERHTQRLHDCRRTKFRRFVEPGRLCPVGARLRGRP